MEVTMSFTDSRNRQETARFTVYRFADLGREERRGFQIIGREEWADEDDYRIEKRAAQQCGIQPGEICLVKFEFV